VERINGTRILVAGGSRGLGLGVVEALVARGAEVSVLARDGQRLAALHERLGVRVVVGDVTDPAVPAAVLAELAPEVVVLHAGLPPPMESIATQSWDDFSAVWNHDVKAGLAWLQAALRAPLARRGRVLLCSSGAALQGSPLSGGYAGAKRMLWLMADYANALAAERELGIRFQVLVPRQMVGGTGTGDAGSRAYATKKGISPEAFLASFGAPLVPRAYGELVAELLADPAHARGTAFAFKAESGLSSLDGP
jgi:NAD(P)-dependent dehydrogenase (short-subunit alcohol dehydrogenase family)